MFTEIIRCTRDRENGWKGVWRWGKRKIIYLSLHCHHQNDSCIKMAAVRASFIFHCEGQSFSYCINCEGHFHIALTVRDKVTRHCPQITTFWRGRRAKMDLNRGPSAYLPYALLLGQTSSLCIRKTVCVCL